MLFCVGLFRVAYNAPLPHPLSQKAFTHRPQAYEKIIEVKIFTVTIAWVEDIEKNPFILVWPANLRHVPVV